MAVLQFACPHCAAALRVRDRTFLGKRVACPDCQQPLEIAEGSDGQLVGVVLPPDPAAAASESPPDATAEPSWVGAAGDRLGRFGWPTVLAAGAIVGLTLGLLGWYFTPPPSPDVATAEAPPEDPAAAPTEPPVEEPEAPAAPEAPKPATDPGVDHPAAARWAENGALVHAEAEEAEHFPAGTVPALRLPPARRFSWLAELSTRFEDAPAAPPLWDLGWQDPLNERFVRRSLPQFQNPRIKAKVGDDGYPATHFIGVAGFGPDAAALPAGDPRAGVFGHDRRTALADLEDGATHTLLATGATDQLGSWAAGGHASLRSFSQEPYVNGPDGIGTGDRDQLLVVMADGSVRTLSASIDPQVLADLATVRSRRSAAPEPAPATPPVVAQTPPPEPPPTEPAPAEPAPADPPVPAATPEPPIDFEARFAAKLLKFQGEASIEAWFDDLQDLLGAPIEFERAEFAAAGIDLKKKLKLQLDAATAGEIWQQFLKAAGLEAEQQARKLVVRPAGGAARK